MEGRWKSSVIKETILQRQQEIGVSDNSSEQHDVHAAQHDEDFLRSCSLLAYHLFPNGMPDPRPLPSHWKEHHQILGKVWPPPPNKLISDDYRNSETGTQMKKKKRSVVSSSEAKSSIQHIRSYSLKYGLSRDQFVFVCTLACAILPTQNNNALRQLNNTTAIISNCRENQSLIVSPISSLTTSTRKEFNTKNEYFVSLIKALIPKKIRSNSDESASTLVKPFYLPGCIVSMLMSCASGNRTNIFGKIHIMRLITLCLRNGYFLSLSSSEEEGNGNGGFFPSARTILSDLYNIPFSILVRNYDCCDNDQSRSILVKDCVRLLYTMTRRCHVTKHRINTVTSLLQKNRRKNTSSISRDLFLLLQLFHTYNISTSSTFSSSSSINFLNSSESTSKSTEYLFDMLKFPDEKWSNNFLSHVAEFPVCDNSHHQINPEKAFNDISSIENFLDGVGIVSVLGVCYRSNEDYVSSNNVGINNNVPTITTSASKLLDNPFLGSLLLSYEPNNDGIESQKNNGNYSTSPRFSLILEEIDRLRKCLSFMLYDEWNNQGTTDPSSTTEGKEKLIYALSKQLATYIPTNNTIKNDRVQSNTTKSLQIVNQDIQKFILNEIFPFWQNMIMNSSSVVVKKEEKERKDSLEHCICICLSKLSPITLKEDWKNKFLSPLAKIYIGSSSNIQHMIISKILSPLVVYWGNMLISTLSLDDDDEEEKELSFVISQSIKELIEWIDKLLLTSLLITTTSSINENDFLDEEKEDVDSAGIELIRLSSVEFFESICKLSSFIISSDMTTSLFSCIVTPPSPQLFYRLLLSDNAFTVELVCGLLNKYKQVFEKLKRYSSGKQDSSASARAVMNITKQKKMNEGVNKYNIIHSPEMLERIAVFNCFVWDVCSTLWRCSQIPQHHSTPTTTLADLSSKSLLFGSSLRGTSISNSLRILHQEMPNNKNYESKSNISLSSLNTTTSSNIVGNNRMTALSITHGAAFSGYTKGFLSKQQQHQIHNNNNNRDKDKKSNNDITNNNINSKKRKSIHQHDPTTITSSSSSDLSFFSTNKKLKLKYLDYLKNLGFENLFLLLTTFVESLSDRERKKQRKKKRQQEKEIIASDVRIGIGNTT